MRGSFPRGVVLASSLALLAGTASITPAAASCIPIDMMLPEPMTDGAVVVLGTVGASDLQHTQLVVEAWYLGDAPADVIWVVGGRTPGTISSVDWAPGPGERFVVLARDVEGSLLTGTCEQASPLPELLTTLADRYGEPRLPPFPAVSPDPSASPVPSAGASPVVTSNDSPAPGSLIHGSPAP